MTILMNFAACNAMADGLSNICYPTTNRNVLEIYKGTMPADPDTWTSGGTDLLATFTSYRFYESDSLDPQGLFMYIPPTVNPVNATATGTAAWFAHYVNFGSFGWMLGDVSTTAGTAAVRLDSLSLTAGNPVTLTYFGFRFTPY